MLRKGVPRQNKNSLKKCCEKGAVLQKGGVAKRATSGVYDSTYISHDYPAVVTTTGADNYKTDIVKRPEFL